MKYRRKLLSALLFAIAGMLASGCTAQQPTTIRVLTYNIHHGEGMDGAVDLQRIADIITKSNADLVALQEVDRGVERTDRVDQPAKLAELTGMQAIFEKNIDYQGGEYGNAVLSRLPVDRYENHPLPQSRPGEQRGMLEVHARSKANAITFLATHFDYHPDDGERMASVAVLKQIVERNRETTVIVAGDLNAKPDSRVIEQATTFLQDSSPLGEGDQRTFPADKLDRRIDYVLIENEAPLRCVEYRVIDESVASDHRPLLAVFEFE